MQVTYENGLATAVTLNAAEADALEREPLMREAGPEAWVIARINRAEAQRTEAVERLPKDEQGATIFNDPDGNPYPLPRTGEAIVQETIDNIAAVRPPLDYIAKRHPRYRDQLAALKGKPGADEIVVYGFLIDALLTQVVASAGGLQNCTQEIQDIAATVASIKQQVPKP